MLLSIKKTILEKGYTLFERPYELNITGIRCPPGLPDRFNDFLTVFYKRDDKQWVFNFFKATTQPGIHWLTQPINNDGAALLKPGQYINAYQLGMHRQKYRALIQTQPVTVIRDNNHDDKADFDTPAEQSGLFGINIHHASETGTTAKIGRYSAGCQVLADIHDFYLLVQLAERHRKLYGNRFTYTLLNLEELKK